MFRIISGIRRIGRLHPGNLLGALLPASLLLPQLAHGQVFKTVELGSYVLRTSPQVRQQGGLYQQSSEKLLVRDLTGKNVSFSPQQVSSFRINNRQFVSTGGFQLRNGFGSSYVTQAFAEQLDSGQVVLLRYQPLPTGAAGRGNIGYNDKAAAGVYLLRFANTLAVTPVQADYSPAAFRAALRPYLAARPDLLQLLDEKHVQARHLAPVIYALNHNQPYHPAADK
jgi:hypothetical protein